MTEAPAKSVAATNAAHSAGSTQKKKSTQTTRQRFSHMLAGSVAGMTSKIVLQPLDLVKTRMQVQDGTSHNEYKGVRHAILQIVRNEGITGLYRGLTPNLVGSGVSWGCYFFTYNLGKSTVREHLGLSQHEKLAAPYHLACAATAGTITTLITNPIWMVKTRLQLQGKEISDGSRQYRGIGDAMTRIIREEGPLSLYRGIAPALMLVSNGALQFTAYEELKKFMVTHVAGGDESKLGPHHFLSMGACAKVVASTLTFPLSVTRSRLYQRKPDYLLKQSSPAAAVALAGPTSDIATNHQQTPTERIVNEQHTVRTDMKYRNMRHVISSVLSSEGARGFYRGLVPHLMKTTPSSAITFLCYESVLRVIGGGAPSPSSSKSKVDAL